MLLLSRRLRVLEWLAGSGFGLLNVLEGVEAAFLEVAVARGLADKSATAGALWDRLRPSVRDATGWIDQVARLELLLIHARVEQREIGPAASGTRWQLCAGAQTARLDPRAVTAHELLPDHDVPPGDRAALLSRALDALGPAAPAPQAILAVPGLGDEDGALFAIDDGHASVLEALAAAPLPLEELARRLPAAVLEELLAIKALVPGVAP